MLGQYVKLHHSTLRDVLKLRTKGVHERLHYHSHFVALFDETIALYQYAELMKRFHGFYAPLDHAIERVLGSQSASNVAYKYAQRVYLIEQDLADLGFDAATIAQNRTCAEIAQVVTPASLAGVLYVIEGSTLGAAQIDRAAQKILSKDSLQGRRFWAWCRGNNKLRWNMMSAYLDDLDASGIAQDGVVNGARDTFQALANWLEPLNQPVLATQGDLL